MFKSNPFIRVRRDTAENWSLNNIVLKVGEPGLETDTNKLKFGNGSTPWNSLPYLAGSGGGGSSANTGDISFNGVKIIGSGTASGDGNEYSTMELVPDNDLYNNHQYLIVDPTGPNHIHLRAGGPQDDSNAEVIVGGEKNNIRVNDQSPLVRMQTETLVNVNSYYFNNVFFSSAVWETVDGNHRVVVSNPSGEIYNAILAFGPTSIFTVTDNATDTNLTITGSSTPGGSNPIIISVTEAPPSNPTNLDQLIFNIKENRQTYIEANGGDVRIEAGDDVRIYSHDTFRLYNYSSTDAIEIITDYNDDDYRWRFQSDGLLEFPDGTTNSGGTVIAPGTYNIQSIDNTLIQTSANAGAKSWNFGSNGNLTLPSGSILSETNNTVSLMPPTAASGQSLVVRPTAAIWAISSSNYIEYGNPITIVVTLQSWAYFGTVNYTISGTGVTPQSLGRALTGKLTFVSTSGPDAETITWTIPANSNISEFTLTLTSVDGTRSTDPQTENDPTLYYNFEENAMPIGQFVTVTNDGMSNSEHSHVHLVAGDPSTVDIYLGDDDQYVKIQKDGGDVIIGTDNNNNHWIFGTDGRLRLPIDGDILDSNGTSVLGGSTTVVASSYSSTINTDAATGDIFDITLTGNTTLANPTNPVNGKTLRWRITQDSTGNRVVTLGNKFNIPSSSTSPLPWSTAPNKMDIVAATYHAGRDKWDVVAFVPGY
jgi:hypothetical protein